MGKERNILLNRLPPGSLVQVRVDAFLQRTGTGVKLQGNWFDFQLQEPTEADASNTSSQDSSGVQRFSCDVAGCCAYKRISGSNTDGDLTRRCRRCGRWPSEHASKPTEACSSTTKDHQIELQALAEQ